MLEPLQLQRSSAASRSRKLGGLASTRRRCLAEQVLRIIAAEHGYRVTYSRCRVLHKLKVWRFAGECGTLYWKRTLTSTAVHQFLVNLGIAHRVH